MEYVHNENGYTILFTDEKDYLRVRLIYLEHFTSSSPSFLSFVQNYGYQGREPIRRGRMEVRNVSVELQPSATMSSPYTNLNGREYSLESQRRAVEDLRNRPIEEVSLAHGFDTPYESGTQSLIREQQYQQMFAMQREQQYQQRRELNEQDFRALMELVNHPIQNSSSAIETMQAIREAGLDFPPTPAVPEPRQISEEEFRREYFAEAIEIDEELDEYVNVDIDEENHEKEEVVEKKLIKKQSIFDIIDID